VNSEQGTLNSAPSSPACIAALWEPLRPGRTRAARSARTAHSSRSSQSSAPTAQPTDQPPEAHKIQCSPPAAQQPGRPTLLARWLAGRPLVRRASPQQVVKLRLRLRLRSRFIRPPRGHTQSSECRCAGWSAGDWPARSGSEEQIRAPDRKRKRIEPAPSESRPDPLQHGLRPPGRCQNTPPKLSARLLL